MRIAKSELWHIRKNGLSSTELKLNLNCFFFSVSPELTFNGDCVIGE